MRILITGNLGSGKTTFANKLGKFYNIKVFSIDDIVHDDLNSTKRTSKEQISIINKINRENKNYILEGVLRKNMDFVMNIVDSIIVIDLDKKILKKRVKKRYIKQKLGIEKINYKVDKKLLNKMYDWINEYDYNRINILIKKYGRKITYLKSNRDIKKYFIALESRYK